MKVKEFFDKFNSSTCNNINDVENLIEDNYSCVKYENNNNLITKIIKLDDGFIKFEYEDTLELSNYTVSEYGTVQ